MRLYCLFIINTCGPRVVKPNKVMQLRTDPCARLNLVPNDTQVVLRSAHFVSVVDVAGSKVKRFPLPRRRLDHATSSVCRRAVALVCSDRETATAWIKEGRVQLVRQTGVWTIIVEVPSKSWLPPPTERRSASSLAIAGGLATAVGVAALGLLALVRTSTAGGLSTSLSDLERLQDQKSQLEQQVKRSAEAHTAELTNLRQTRAELEVLLQDARAKLADASTTISALQQKTISLSATTTAKNAEKPDPDAVPRLAARVAEARARVTASKQVTPGPSTETIESHITDAHDWLNLPSEEQTQRPSEARRLSNLLFVDMANLVGAVQVFVRIRAREGDKDAVGCIADLPGASVRGTLTVGDKTFRDMPIYDPTTFTDNESVFNRAAPNQPVCVADMVRQVADGASVAMLSYGSSNAGKSHLMTKDSIGILWQSLQLLEDKGLKFRFLVFEEALREVKSAAGGVWKVTDQVILLHGTFPLQIQSLVTRPFTGISSSIKLPAITLEESDGHDDGLKSATEFASIMDTIQKKRIKTGRIMPTINNKQSSRSHLYIVISCFKEDTKLNAGVLTLIDMAGIERPNEMYSKMRKVDYESFRSTITNTQRNYFTNAVTFPIENKNINTLYTNVLTNPSEYLTQVGAKTFSKGQNMLIELKNSDSQKFTEVNYNGVFVKTIEEATKTLNNTAVITGYGALVLKQGIFINESLNEMRAFLLQRRGTPMQKRSIQKSVLKYDVNSFFNSEADNRSGDQAYMQTKELLRYIDNPTISQDLSCRTKWVVLVSISPEAKDCTDTMYALLFGRSISAV